MDHGPSSSWVSSLGRPRPWVTLLVALVMGLAAGAGWLAMSSWHAHLGRHNVVLLVPERNLSEPERREAAATLSGESMIATWLAPAEQADLISQRMPGRLLEQVLPPESGWMPWMLELRPRNPLTPLQPLIYQVEDQGGWLAFHDARPLAEHKRLYQAFTGGLGIFLLLVGLAGSLALRRLPTPGLPESLLTAMAAAVAAPLALVPAWLVGLPLDASVPLVAAGAGCLVAALAPLRGTRSEDQEDIQSKTLTEASR